MNTTSILWREANKVKEDPTDAMIFILAIAIAFCVFAALNFVGG